MPIRVATLVALGGAPAVDLTGRPRIQKLLCVESGTGILAILWHRSRRRTIDANLCVRVYAHALQCVHDRRDRGDPGPHFSVHSDGGLPVQG